MNTRNTDLMKMARQSLDGKWGLAIGAFFVIGLIKSISSFFILIIGGPIMLGISIFSLALVRNTAIDFDYVFKGFNNFGKSLGVFLLGGLIVILGYMLFIIPGIYLTYCYAMAFYVLADNPDMDVMEVLNKSKEMMEGHKFKLFRMHLRFAGLFILCIFTLFIGLFWLIPYMRACTAMFYEDINGRDKEAEDVADHLIVPEIF
jgi:uncharacterized membrane protein